MTKRLGAQRRALLALGSAALVASFLFGAMGGTASASETALNWYQCGKAEGTGVYEDANCSKTGASNTYSWLHFNSTPFSANNSLGKGAVEAYVLQFFWYGKVVSIQCTTSTGTGTMVNTGSRAEIENFQLTLHGCTTNGGCTVKSSPGKVEGEIGLQTLIAHSPEVPNTHPDVMFERPTGGESFGAFRLEGCSDWKLNKAFNLETKQLHTEMDNGHSRLLIQSPLSEYSTLYVNEEFAGLYGLIHLEGEGGKPFKLDTKP